VLRADSEATGHHALGFFEAIGQALFPSGLGLESAFAATVLVLAGGLGGWMLAHRGTATAPETAFVTFESGDLVASGDLKVALETMPSFAAANDDDTERAITLVQSFPSREKRFCREFTIGSVAAAHVNGLACRTGARGWRIVAHGGVAPSADDRNGEFHSAGDISSPAVTVAVDSLKAGLALDVEDEKTLIASGWSSTSK
jgi:hypothetical protein